MHECARYYFYHIVWLGEARKIRGWTDSTASKALALCVVDPGSIPNIPYNPLSTFRSYFLSIRVSSVSWAEPAEMKKKINSYTIQYQRTVQNVCFTVPMRIVTKGLHMLAQSILPLKYVPNHNPYVFFFFAGRLLPSSAWGTRVLASDIHHSCAGLMAQWSCLVVKLGHELSVRIQT